MDLSNNQVELTTYDAKPNKPAGSGFGLHSEGNRDKPICLSASSTPVPSTNIFGSPEVSGYAGNVQWSPFSTLMAGYERDYILLKDGQSKWLNILLIWSDQDFITLAVEM